MTVNKTKPHAKMQKAADVLRKCALAYPGAHEDSPWDHAAFKVGKKVFVFMGVDGEGLGLSFKLNDSHFQALALPYTEPTHYGLGKHGWVSAAFAPHESVPTAMLARWIDESYRLIAPKKLIKQLGSDESFTPKLKTGGKLQATRKRAGKKPTDLPKKRRMSGK